MLTRSDSGFYFMHYNHWFSISADRDIAAIILDPTLKYHKSKTCRDF